MFLRKMGRWFARGNFGGRTEGLRVELAGTTIMGGGRRALVVSMGTSTCTSALSVTPFV